jgi:chlorobactene glucosyltransferase
MAVVLAGGVWVCVVAWLIIRATRRFAAHHATSLVRLAGCRRAKRVDVTVIVPARNEIDNIGDCLASLTTQRGLGDRAAIIVVDDGSDDGTGDSVIRAALRDPRITLIRPDQLPAGWMGKPHACWHGAKAASAEWLCFIDADVRAGPELICVAVAAAERHRIDMMSLSPFQLLGSFWERLIIPAGLLLVGCTGAGNDVDNPASSEISANGQFILVRREVYFAVGGHRAVRSQTCEDKALAGCVKRAGWRYRMLSGEELVRTRMYTNLAALWEGFSKNATEIIGDGPSTIAAAAAAMAVGWAALLLPLLAGAVVAEAPTIATLIGFVLVLSGFFAIVGIHFGTTRYFRIPAMYALFFPFAYTMIFALACRSAALRREGRVIWKGRTYEFHP